MVRPQGSGAKEGIKDRVRKERGGQQAAMEGSLIKLIEGKLRQAQA